MKTTALRLATATAAALTLGGVAFVAPLSAFAYYGALPSYQPAYSVCSGAYDPNCFIKSTEYLNQSSAMYEPYAGYSNYNNSYYPSYSNNSYYAPSYSSSYPSYNSYSSYPSYNSSYNSYYPSNSYSNYYTPSYNYSTYPSYSNSYYNPSSYSYQYQYQYQYHY